MPPNPPRKPTDLGLIALLFTVFMWWQSRDDAGSATIASVSQSVAVLQARVANLETLKCSLPSSPSQP